MIRFSAVVLSVVAFAGCAGTIQLSPNDADEVLQHQTLAGPSPAESGDLEVLTLYYGSGTDKNRPEYRDSVAITTSTVDASKLVSLGGSADSRNEYWGFAPDSFPLNARVWYPEGEGPFPLVLVVHGNHNMRDFSDPGYDWLGELLASQGYILASVDMNFINGGIRGENDGRGWLLLKHLQAWEDFNADPENPFYGLVDMSRIALMGHSRGGEAVGHAAAFNRLERYPDDASLTFDFGFDIKAVVAIAPVDGQYLPTDRHVPVEDVNYLVFHGSHDGDVTSFHGLRQFNRVSFSDEGDWFKSAVYVYRANHGQWNTVWGAHDNGPRSPRILDLRALLEPEEQREFGRVFIGAFLDITLKGRDRYRPLFRDHRVAGEWLPKTMYITRFMDSSFRPLADFEGDIDVTTGSIPGVQLKGNDLGTWSEGMLGLRSSNRPTTSSSQVNQAVWLGWNNTFAGSGDDAPAASYEMAVPASQLSQWGVGRGWSLEFHLTATEDSPGPRKDPNASENDEEEASEPVERPESPEAEDEEEDQPVEVTIEVVDGTGQVARLQVSDYGPIRKPLETWVLRRKDRERDRFASHSELVLQHFSIPLEDFVAANARFNPRTLTTVRWVFDQTVKGTVVLDDVGLANMHPAFMANPVRP